MIGNERLQQSEVVSLTGGSGGASLAPLANLVPDARVTMIVSMTDGGNRTNDIREALGGPAVGDLRKVLGYVSTNAAGCLFHTRYTHGDSLDDVARTGWQFMEAAAIADTAEADKVMAMVTDVATTAQAYSRTLEGHTYGNFVLTALRLCKGDDLQYAADTANTWLQTAAHVLPVTTQSHNLVLYDGENHRIVYGEGQIDKYVIHNLAKAELWLETGETRNFIEEDPRLVNQLLDTGIYAPRPMATYQAQEAIKHAGVIVVGPGSPLTSLRPTVLQGGMRRVFAIQAARGGQLLIAPNSLAEPTTPGLDFATYASWLEEDAGRRFDHVAYGVHERIPEDETVHRLAGFVRTKLSLV